MQLSPPRIVAAWIFIVAMGMAVLTRHEFAPVPEAHGASTWPAQMQIMPDPDRPTLLMFLHPDCPCSDASMEEFTHLVGRIGDKAAARVIFFSWEDQPLDPRQSRHWKAAARLPGVALRTDMHGTLADQFGVISSGQVLLYDRGRLLFSGGIVGERGHVGDNPGVRAVIQGIEAACEHAQPGAGTNAPGAVNRGLTDTSYLPAS